MICAAVSIRHTHDLHLVTRRIHKPRHVRGRVCRSYVASSGDASKNKKKGKLKKKKTARCRFHQRKSKVREKYSFGHAEMAQAKKREKAAFTLARASPRVLETTQNEVVSLVCNVR